MTKFNPKAWGFPSYEEFRAAQKPLIDKAAQGPKNADVFFESLGLTDPVTKALWIQEKLDISRKVAEQYPVDSLPPGWSPGGEWAIPGVTDFTDDTGNYWTENQYNTAVKRHVRQLSPALDPFNESSGVFDGPLGVPFKTVILPMAIGASVAAMATAAVDAGIISAETASAIGGAVGVGAETGSLRPVSELLTKIGEVATQDNTQDEEAEESATQEQPQSGGDEGDRVDLSGVLTDPEQPRDLSKSTGGDEEEEETVSVPRPQFNSADFSRKLLDVAVSMIPKGNSSNITIKRNEPKESFKAPPSGKMLGRVFPIGVDPTTRRAAIQPRLATNFLDNYDPNQRRTNFL